MTSNIINLHKTGAAACAFLALSAMAVSAEVEDHIRRTFTVGPGGQLTVKADRGSITVTAGDSTGVEIDIMRNVKRASKARAEKVFRDHEISFSQDGNNVKVVAGFKREPRLWDDIWHRFQVRYTITVPSQFNVDLKTAGGTITIGNLTGKVRAETSGGSLKFGKIDGSVWGRTAGGGITLLACTGQVEVKTSGGSINLGEVEGKVSAGTAGGSISVKKALGDAELKTSGGSINVDEITGMLDAGTAGGSIRVRQAGKSVVAKTSGGGIDISEAKGTVDASTSGGSITGSFAVQPEGDCKLKGSGGSITVYLKDSLAFDVDARTSGGRVVTDVPVTVQGEHKSASLRGRINGGGPALILQTSAGNINLRKYNTGPR
jgi:hypothetical protein